MRLLVLGAGLQGSACAFDLLETTDAKVTLADAAPEKLPAFLQAFRGRRLAVLKVDVRDQNSVMEVMRGHDAVLSALPYYLNFELARNAVEAGIHFADLGGNTDVVRQQETLNNLARKKGVSVVPDCGLAPGLVNVLAAEGIRRLDAVDCVKLYVGGLPRHPEPPLNYQVVYSLEGAIDYYTTPSWVLREGKPVQVEALSDIELVPFPRPIGKLEAFHTAGGVSTMPWKFQGKIPRMEYKTLRYPGHAEIMRAIRALGLLDQEPVNVSGTTVKPRDLFVAVVDPKFRKPQVEDIVVLKVVVAGKKSRRKHSISFQLIDHYDRTQKISAMMRTTGYSLSIVGQMQADGRVRVQGVRACWEAVPFGDYMGELKKRGIKVRAV